MWFDHQEDAELAGSVITALTGVIELDPLSLDKMLGTHIPWIGPVTVTTVPVEYLPANENFTMGPPRRLHR